MQSATRSKTRARGSHGGGYCWLAFALCTSAFYLVSFHSQLSSQETRNSGPAASNRQLISNQFPLISANQKSLCDIEPNGSMSSLAELDLLQQNALQTSPTSDAIGDSQLLQSDVSRLLTNGQALTDVEHFYKKSLHWQGQTSVHSLYQTGMITKVVSTSYSDLYQHQYDDFDDLKVSGGPRVDQDKCIEQLEQLNRRVASKLDAGLFATVGVNILLLMDSFGRPGSGIFMGNVFWEGDYDTCLSTKITLDVANETLSSTSDHSDNQVTTETRYCVARLMHPNWKVPKQAETMLSLKTATCLPRACDSQNYKNKFQLVKSLVMAQAGDLSQGQLELTGLYCLPDEESPLRAWWGAPGTLIGLLVILAWTLFLVYCTARDNQLCLLDQDQASRHPYRRLYKSLSISRNLCALLACAKTTNNSDSQQVSRCEATAPVVPVAPVLNFSIIEGVKVLSLCYIICGHIIMILPVTVSNPASIGILRAPMLVASNLLPAFAVNAFFTITGLLTANMVLKTNKAAFLFKTPSAWLKFLILRYLRIMPLYAIVIYYTKHMAKYTSDGPYWDYGTSRLSQRKLCEQESWSWVLMFGANFKSPLEHCVPSAWYLANDFQFMIVTPIFLYLLDRYETAGKRITYFCIALATVSSFLSVFWAPLADFKPIAAIMPHAFKTYVSYLSSNYTQPQNRIQAYLVGLLIGKTLTNFESRKIKYLEAKQALERAKQDEQATSINEEKQQTVEQKTQQAADSLPEEPKLEGWLVQNAAILGSLALLIGALIPSIAHRIPYSLIGPSFSKFMVSFIMPFYHLVFSAGVGVYMMVAITGQGNKMVNAFLGSPIWVPLARISLVVMLINIEVICFLLQSTRKAIHLNMLNHFQMVVTSIVCSYATGFIVYLIFEAPLKSMLSQLMTAGAGKIAEKKKIS